MTTYKNENAVVEAITKAIHKTYLGAYVIKVHGGMYQEAGIPDLLVVVDGLLTGIEVKHQKPGESKEHALDRTTIRQRSHISRIVAAGGMAGVATTPEEALYLIQLNRLKQSQMAKGVDPKDLPLPPEWDFLMKVDESKKILETEVLVDPTPLKKRK